MCLLTLTLAMILAYAALNYATQSAAARALAVHVTADDVADATADEDH